MRLQSVIGILIGHVIVKPIWDKINESLYRQELSRMYKSKAAFHFLIKIYSFALKWVAGNSSVFLRCFWGSPCSCRSLFTLLYGHLLLNLSTSVPHWLRSLWFTPQKARPDQRKPVTSDSRNIAGSEICEPV